MISVEREIEILPVSCAKARRSRTAYEPFLPVRVTFQAAVSEQSADEELYFAFLSGRNRSSNLGRPLDVVQ